MTDANNDTHPSPKEAEGTAAEVVVQNTDYELDLDSHREVLYYKEHSDGRQTQVHIEGRYADWGVSVIDIDGRDELGGQSLGGSEEKREAQKIAREWMRAHPEGVEG